MNFNERVDTEHATETGRGAEREVTSARKSRRGRLAGLSLVLAISAALASGAWSHYAQQRQIVATAEQDRDFTPGSPCDLCSIE